MSINEIHKKNWDEAIRRFGGVHSVPHDEANAIAERTRALHILDLPDDPGMSRGSNLLKYGVSQSLITELTGMDVPLFQKKLTILEKETNLKKWCMDNVGSQIGVDVLITESGFSRGKCISFMDDNVGMFAFVKRGLYEIRDPKVERQLEKVS